MKKIVISITALFLLVCVAGGGFLMFRHRSVEYALTQIYKDVKESGITGLEEHLTENSREFVEKVTEWSEHPLVAGALLFSSQYEEVSFLKSQIKEIAWTVEDLLKGKKRTDVVIGFNYQEQVVGTVDVILIYVDREWKIDSISVPVFEKFSLKS